jgi:membrane protein
MATSIWSANAGMKALFDALNVAYGEKESRGFIALNATSLAFTAGMLVFALFAISAAIVVPIVLKFVALGPAFETLLRWSRWPVLLGALALALALLYRFGPTRKKPRWRWITVGSAFAGLTWIAASAGFSWYAANFGSYNETYGTLGAVIGFMTWIWISVIVIMVGAELNAEVEAQAKGSTAET